MKRIVLLASILGVMVTVGPASAAVILDFGTGTMGSGGDCTITATTAVCTGINIGSLTVINAGTASGTYLVDGGTQGVQGGTLSFSVSTTSPGTDTMSIVGSVDCAAGSGLFACSAADDLAFKQLVASGTTLLAESGALNGLTITGAGGPTATVSFGSGFDLKSRALMTALGITSTGVCGATLCSGWTLGGFSISAQIDGTHYTAFSTDIPNTQNVPEPTSILLLGTVLFGVTHVIRRRARKA